MGSITNPPPLNYTTPLGPLGSPVPLKFAQSIPKHPEMDLTKETQKREPRDKARPMI